MNRHISAFAAAALWWTQSALAQPAAAPAPAAAAPAAPAPAATDPSQSADATPPSPVEPADNAARELGAQVSAQRADIDEQDTRLLELEQQLKQLTAAAAHPVPPPPPPAPPAPVVDPHDQLKVTGYAQAQYELHQDSEDQLQPGGATLNQNRFLIRRARVKLLREWTYGAAMLEVDGNTIRGPAMGLQHAEVSVAYRNPDYTPLIALTVGLFDNPFGREVIESPRERPFVERSFASRAFFPSEPDLGLRIAGQLAWFRYAVGIVNGQPLGDRTGFILQDPNSHKDVLGRVGVAVDARPNLRVIGGVSVLNGRGFHPGSDATKNTIVWRDANEDGQFAPGEFQAVPGRAAVPSQNFDRWALGADLGLELESRFGKSKLFGELSAGSNMDRNVFVADPITTSFDQRELGYYVLFTHEFKQGPIVGFRYDSYNPNSDFLDRQAGKLVPLSETVSTYSPLVGFQVPHRLRAVIEYDVIRDSLARNSAGVPTDRANNTWTFRLQGEL